jgi:predicted  nucleic acid-binding Zn-ribbon protein
MTQMNPGRADEIRKEIAAAQSAVNELASKTRLTTVRDEISGLETDIQNLETRIRKIRDRKYAFNKILETQAVDFRKQWLQKRPAAMMQLNKESNLLTTSLQPLERRAANLHAVPHPGAAAKRLQEEVTACESRVDAAEDSIKATYSDLKQEVDKVEAQLALIEKTLDLSETATFGFLPAESVIRAVKAVWTRDGKEDKEDPEGFLFLTDQRLLFEQREEIATKKVLFVTTERKKLQQLLFEIPVFSITSIKAEKQGVFKNEDWLKLEFAPGSFTTGAVLHIDGQSCDTWQGLLNQAKTKEFDSDRAIALDQAAVEKALSAPEKCPNCGGAITKPVLRGMDSITCDFCGLKIKL